jgi:hypothetical protein
MRIWDNVFAYGTRFLISAVLAILKLIEPNLLSLSNLGDINDYFKQMREPDAHNSLLPEVEVIINEARRINISNERIAYLMNRDNLSPFKQIQKPVESCAEEDGGDLDQTLHQQVPPNLQTIQAIFSDLEVQT